MRKSPIGTPETVVLAGIELTLTRKHVKNVNLRIKPDGEVRMSAPTTVPLSSLEQIVRARLPWIERARARYVRKANETGQLLQDGDTVPLWGTPRTLSLVSHASGTKRTHRRCLLSPDDASVLVMELDERLCGTDDEALSARRALVDALYKAQIQTEAPRMLSDAEAIVGKRASRLRYRKMTSRWGSCNVQTASVTLNTQLAAYPPSCLEYVIIHELCHLYEPSHNARFHALMDGYCPAWRTRRAQLKAGPLHRAATVEH